jgi:hypothetical protein
MADQKSAPAAQAHATGAGETQAQIGALFSTYSVAESALCVHEGGAL